MNGRIGYLAESGYLTEGNVIRHGDVLRDMMVDGDENNRALGMIGMLDAEVKQSELLSGDAVLAHIVLIMRGNVHTVPVYYMDPLVRVYGLDPDITGLQQVIRVEMLGFQSIAVVTVIGG